MNPSSPAQKRTRFCMGKKVTQSGEELDGAQVAAVQPCFKNINTLRLRCFFGNAQPEHPESSSQADPPTPPENSHHHRGYRANPSAPRIPHDHPSRMILPPIAGETHPRHAPTRTNNAARAPPGIQGRNA